ncbi:MAG: hypothetical protein WCT31_02035 [Candidatus Micrarchaeia archaeon]
MIDKKLALKIALLVVLLVAAVVVITPVQKAILGTAIEPDFRIVEYGRSGDVSYVAYSHAGTGNLKLLSLNSTPIKDIYLLDQKGIGNDNFGQFAARIKELDKYGFTVRTVGPDSDVTSGIYVVTTGAMPTYVLENLKRSPGMIVIYFGQTDLLIKSTTKKEDWYSELPLGLKKRIIVKNTTSDSLLNSSASMDDLVSEMLESRWSLANEKIILLSGKGNSTSVLQMNGGTYLRAVYSLKGDSNELRGMYEGSAPSPANQISIAGDVFPWEEGWAEIVIEKSSGIATLDIKKDGQIVESEKFDRISEQSVFKKLLKFPDAGEYVLEVNDNNGMLANGLFHVKNLSISINESRDSNYYLFYVTVDGEPVKDAKALVKVKDSPNAPQEFSITNGFVPIQAKFKEASGTLSFTVYGGTVDVFVSAGPENIYDTYLKYGPIGIIAIIIVYAFARLNKRQTYIIRVGEVAPEIRKELRMTSEHAKEIFKSARKNLKIEGPLKAHEFSVGLKRYVTDGADITEGNVEEILKKMETLGIILSWNGYYQLVRDGRIKMNVMKRIIREKLIERGIHFKLNGEKFVTRDFEIGFFGDHFSGKAIIVFEDMADIKKEIAGLDDKQRSRLFIKEFNGVLNLISIDKLDDVL